ncbi:MAG: thermonuclease family protein [Clostridia bacterium]|nr:thermonuclease family protein [Clostridia bacterium]
MTDRFTILKYTKRAVSLLLVLALAFSLALASGCKKPSGDPDSTSEPDIEGNWEYVRDPSLPDYGTMVTLNPAGHDGDIDKTGRGRVTVEQFIDGDTVHFYNNSKTELIKARFLAIDTPESTGHQEPWGHPASIYTKTKLRNAEEIVLESDTEGVVGMDGNGRYLCWVWYREKGSDTFRNLNIELLADGLAMGKSTSSTRYGSVASEALQSARSNRINMYSGKRDPLFYYGETVELSIKSLVSNKETYNAFKVRFEGVVTKESGGGIYVEQYDEDTQQNYGVYV